MSSTLKTADTNGSLEGWYASEKIFGLQETREMVQRRFSGKVKNPIKLTNWSHCRAVTAVLY